VDLLLQLDEPVLSLCKEFLLHSKNRLFEALDYLQLQVDNLNQVNLILIYIVIYFINQVNLNILYNYTILFIDK